MKKNLFVTLLFVLIIFSCKDENEKTRNIYKGPVKIESEEEQATKTEKTKEVLPPNTVQLNEDAVEFPGVDVILNKVQIVNTDGNKFLAKVFFNTDLMELYQNGNYIMFIQNHPYDNNFEASENVSATKVPQSLSVNIEFAKKYSDEYVLFRSFKSPIYDFEKVIVGFYDIDKKQDLFRTQFDNASIIK